MTDGTQELDEILENLTTAASDGQFIEDGSIGEAKVDILDWHNKQTLELLDRLEAQFVEEVVVIFGKTEVKKQVPLSAIEAERERCKS